MIGARCLLLVSAAPPSEVNAFDDGNHINHSVIKKVNPKGAKRRQLHADEPPRIIYTKYWSLLLTCTIEALHQSHSHVDRQAKKKIEGQNFQTLVTINLCAKNIKIQPCPSILLSRAENDCMSMMASSSSWLQS